MLSGEADIRSSVNHLDFIFKNKLVTVIAVKSSPEINLVGFSLGPFEEGREYEVRLCFAQELEREGLVRIKDGGLDAAKLYKIHWTERIQSLGQLATLPEDFYPRLRRLINELKDSSKASPERMREYEYVQNLAQDIVNCRLRKIVSLASISMPEGQALKNLTFEEKSLYDSVRQIVSEWRSKII